MISKRCSNKSLHKKSVTKFKKRLVNNGFKKVNFTKTLPKSQKKNSSSDMTCLTLDYLSDKHCRLIKNRLKKYSVPIRLVSKPSRFLKQCFNSKNVRKHVNCSICEHLPNDFTCNDRLLVYKFTCKFCNEYYIGETSRPFAQRYKEHSRSLQNQDDKSALSCHLKSVHQDQLAKIADFDLEILARCQTPVATRLAEARLITNLRPKLNRKFEKAHH